ncbi:MAG TPA: O-antigen polysaccharide polymerase Wzy [Bryobacterales bacterium]|nr:O-antigen polysaccharide polymerase Wzy [Bryobacterales bacterium]
MGAPLRLRLLWAALAVALGAALYMAALAVANDRFSALLAGGLLAAVFSLCLGPLQFSPLSPFLLYLSVFALFHLGMALPWALGLTGRHLPWWFLTSRLTPSLGLIVLALASYLAGALGARRRPRRSAEPEPAYSNEFLFGCGLAVYLAGGVMFALGVESLGGARFFEAGYGETYRLAAEFDPRFFGTSFTVVPIGLYLAAASFPRRRLGLVIALALAWVGGIFFLGFRGFALIPGLVVLALLRRRGHRAPAWVNVALLLVVLGAIPLARAVRDRGVSQRSLDHFWTEVRPLDGIIEMGGSLRPLVHTLRYMQTEPWRWGRTYWQSLSTVWPNLAGRWQGARYIPLEELPPNHWLTAQAEPDMYRHYGGLGFSAVAEPYMNFGVPGVIVYFWALGALLAAAGEFRSAHPAPLAAWAMVLGPLLWTTRNSFEIFFRPAAWGLGVVWAARFAAGLAGRKAGQRPAGWARNLRRPGRGFYAAVDRQ